MMDIVVAHYLINKTITKPVAKPLSKPVAKPIVKPIIKSIHNTTCNLCGQYIYCCLCNYI